MSNSISSLVRSCLRQLDMIITSHELDEYHSEVPPNLWSDELGRLRVWTANMGAHHRSQKSLDYRLRDASHLKDQTLRVLRRLERTIHDLETYIHGTETFGQLSSESDSDEEDQTELQQTYCSLQDTINLLFKASRSIRRPAQHDRLLGVKRSDTVSFEPFDRQHVADKFPLLSDVVIDRLGLAISQRRAILRYRERHHLKLAQGLDAAIDNGEDNISSGLSETVATEFCQDVGNDTFETQSSISQTSYAGTIMDGGEGISVPPPPIDFSQCDSFECPYCFLLIDVENKRSWVKHVFNDLMPYICVFPDCQRPHRLYESRREWYAHLQVAHSLPWNSDISIKCPLCHQAMSSGKSFERHVARHLQELALFALPKPGPDKDDESHKSTVLEREIQSSQSDEWSMMHWQARVPREDDDELEPNVSEIGEAAWSEEEVRCSWQGCQYTGSFSGDGTLMRHIKSKHISPTSYQSIGSGESFERQTGHHLQEPALFTLPKPGPDKDEKSHKSTVLEEDKQRSQSDTLSMSHLQVRLPHGDDDEPEPNISKVAEAAWSEEGLRCSWEGCQYTGSFSGEGTLMRHIKSTHVPAERFRCRVAGCDKAFRRKDKLMFHQRDDHGRNV